MAQGFKVGMKVSVTGFTTSNNNSSAIIVKVTDDTLPLAPSSDLTDENAGDSVTISGDLTASTDWALARSQRPLATLLLLPSMNSAWCSHRRLSSLKRCFSQ